MQESNDEKYQHPISSSYNIPFYVSLAVFGALQADLADYSKPAAALAAPLKNVSKSALICSGFVVHMPCGSPG